MNEEYIRAAEEGFSTKRLFMRPFREGDESDIFDYAKNPEVGPAAGWKPHENIEESRRVLGFFIDQSRELTFAVTEKEEGKVIGSISLMDDEKQGRPALEIGYVLSKDYWGRGIMPEAVFGILGFAFEKLGADFVTVYHFAFNEKSKRVIEKCGFTFGGILPEKVRLFDGRETEEFCYYMTKEEFFEKK